MGKLEDIGDPYEIGDIKGELGDGYIELNTQLEAKLLASDDIEANLELGASLKAGADEILSKALDIFLQASRFYNKQKDEGRMCSSFSAKILLRNKILAEAVGAQSRVARVAKSVGLSHVKACKGIYMARYSEKLSKTDPVDRDRLFGILADSLVAYFAKDLSVVVEMMLGVGKTWMEKLCNLVASGLERKAVSEPELDFGAIKPPKGAPFEEKFELAFTKLLRVPCERFVGSFSKDICELAAIELLFSTPAAAFSDTSEEGTQFTFGLFRMRFCEKLLDEEDEFARAIKAEVQR